MKSDRKFDNPKEDMSQSSPLPDADIIQTGPLVPTRILNISTTNVSNQHNHTTYHEVVTIPTRTGNEQFRCHHLDYQYDVVMATICSMYLLFGIIYSLFGYRCFKAIMFLTGFIFGSIIVYLICLQEKLLPSYGNAGVAISAGILFGLITMLVQYVGLFMTGFHTGLFGAVVAVVVAEQCSQITSVWMTTGILLSGGLLFATLNLYWQKGLTIVGTSIYGGAIISIALDYFVEKLQMLHWIWSRVALREYFQPCWFSWLLLSIWPFMVVVGLIIQFTVTGIGIHHEEMIPTKNPPMQRIRTREQRAEMRQKKYRYFYQVRTAHGDVISQSFVQALQRKALTPNPCDQGDMNTLQSDSTHLSHLPSEQTAQLAALTESEDDLNDSRDVSNMMVDSHSSANYKHYR
ncbi:hypothetical protein RUM43_014377 [Polyplax serrata]|uniref:Transmembrane protein 198 n=1 Tax=Polyplax serrata TaxID=468196 RepID=A0AAN8RYS7_POLSC